MMNRNKPLIIAIAGFAVMILLIIWSFPGKKDERKNEKKMPVVNTATTFTWKEMAEVREGYEFKGRKSYNQEQKNEASYVNASTAPDWSDTDKKSGSPVSDVQHGSTVKNVSLNPPDPDEEKAVDELRKTQEALINKLDKKTQGNKGQISQNAQTAGTKTGSNSAKTNKTTPNKQSGQKVNDQQVKRRSGFNDLNKENKALMETDQFISAVIQGTQTIESGNNVKMRLKQDVHLKNAIIPVNTYIYGTASFSGNRVNITVKSIKIGQQVISVNLAVIDGSDGQTGLYVDGMTNIKETVDDLSYMGSNQISTGNRLIDATKNSLQKAFKSKQKVTLVDNTVLILK